MLLVRMGSQDRPAERKGAFQTEAEDLGVLSRYMHAGRPLYLVDEVGRIGITPVYLRPMVAVAEGSMAWHQGVRDGDMIVALDGEAVESITDLFAGLRAAASRDVLLTVRRHESTPGGWPGDLVKHEDREVRLGPGDRGARGVASWNCRASSVIPSSPAANMGLVAGDIVWSVDGRDCRHWGFLEASLTADAGAKHHISWSHGPHRREHEGTTWLGMVVDPEDKTGQRQIRTFGMATEVPIFAAPEPVPNEHRVAFAFDQAIHRTHEAIRMNVAAITGLFSGKVPLTELSGPIGIAQLAARTTERGWHYFFSLMVWLSVSLGLINLLPIPILDGGHILFLALEGIKRKPVSLRTRQVATYIGLAVIMMLFILAFKNDLQRPW